MSGELFLLKKIRDYLRQIGANALIIAHDDEYQNEMLSCENERLAYVTGFSGSAGMAVITDKQAVLFVDGRYVSQAQKQTKFKVLHVPRQTTVTQWLSKHIKKNSVIAYDPSLHSVDQIERWINVCARKNVRFYPCQENPIDLLWEDRPRPPLIKIYSYPKKYAGKTTQQKASSVQKILRENNLDAFIVSSTDTVSWLLNKRSDALSYSPVLLSRCIVPAFGKVQELTYERLSSLKGKVVGIDRFQTPVKIKQDLIQCGVSVRFMTNPFDKLKCVKNSVEIKGIRFAGIKESVALCQFFSDLLENPLDGTELSVLRNLEKFRKENQDYIGNSFPPISAVGAHSSLPHYVPQKNSATKLKGNSIYLLDVGSQFLCGTTDVTRTVSLKKKPSELLVKRYTQVLKGHIAMAKSIFPKGTSGAQLDVLARQFLWQEGLDYDHGTGHGVGAFLNVHETPPSLSKNSIEPLQENMVLTNEPAFYLKNKFGIRLENMMTVQKYKKDWLCFEMLTFIPFCDELINEQDLSEDEKAWMQGYYKNIMEKIYPKVNEKTKKWLEKVCLKWLPL